MDLSTEDVKFEVELTIQSEDPCTPTEVSIPLPLLPVDQHGRFALELLWYDEPIVRVCSTPPDRLHMK